MTLFWKSSCSLPATVEICAADVIDAIDAFARGAQRIEIAQIAVDHLDAGRGDALVVVFATRERANRDVAVGLQTAQKIGAKMPGAPGDEDFHALSCNRIAAPMSSAGPVRFRTLDTVEPLKQFRYAPTTERCDDGEAAADRSRADVAARPTKSKSVVDEYHSFHAGTVETRKANYTKMVNDYYDLVTDFYEYGWGQSFHFAPRHKGESFEASLVRHELYPRARARAAPGHEGARRRLRRRRADASDRSLLRRHHHRRQQQRLPDQRGSKHNEEARPRASVQLHESRLHEAAGAGRSYDAVYAIEATCHAPDKVQAVHRALSA